MESVLYNFLDEWLFNFNADPFFVPFKIEITKFKRRSNTAAASNNEKTPENTDNEDDFVIEALGFGETLYLQKHHQGTEF